jgi:hypothetical protein
VASVIVPQTRAFVLSNSKAVVILFRGTEPTNLVQWLTDAQVRWAGQTGRRTDGRTGGEGTDAGEQVDR